MSDLSIEGKTILKRMLKERCVCGLISTGSGKCTVVGFTKSIITMLSYAKHVIYSVVEGLSF